MVIDKFRRILNLKSAVNLYQHSPVRYFVSITLLILCLLIVSQQLSSFSSIIDVELDDFVEYWSASVLHLEGNNPYDRELLTALQNSVGRSHDVPVLMWNPPWTLALIMPFGSLDFSLARLYWFFTHFIILMACATFIWQLYGGWRRLVWVAWLACLTFGPALLMLKVGQISSFFLLGVVGFLYFERCGEDFLAGAAFSLLSIKPHISYLLIFIFLVWALHEKRWHALVGVIFTITLTSILVYLVNPTTFENYLYATRNYPPVAWATPTVGGIIRYFFGQDVFWCQFVAPILGIFWGGIYYYTHRLKWVWAEEIPLICLLSIATAAYGWLYDQVLVMFALLQVAIWFGVSGRTRSKLLLLISYVGINLLVSISDASQLWFFWLAPTLLALYVFARYSIASPRMEQYGKI